MDKKLFDWGASVFLLTVLLIAPLYPTLFSPPPAPPCPVPLVMNNLDAGSGSLRDIVGTVCDGAVITFDPGFFNTANNKKIYLASQISIAKNLTIDAGGVSGVAVYGGANPGNLSNVRAFSIASGASVVFNAISVYNTFGYDVGSAITNSGTLTVQNGNLNANLALAGGGAIANTGVMTLTNMNLVGNYGSYSGGAILNQGVMRIQGSYLTNNHTDARGGAIANSGVLTVTNQTRITGNSANLENESLAYGWGGGIYNGYDITAPARNPARTAAVNGATPSLTILDSDVDSNGALLQGGGIWNSGGLLIAENAEVNGNSAFGSMVTYTGGDGGGIYSAHPAAGSLPAPLAQLIIQDSQVSANQANLSGGGIWNAGNLVVERSSLESNTAFAHGGGISHEVNPQSPAASTASLDAVIMTGNHCGSSGGAIYAQQPLSVTGDSVFSENSTTRNGGSGGAIAYYGNPSPALSKTLVATPPDFILTGGQFSDNQSNFGGALYLEKISTEISGTHILSNTSTDGAGIQASYVEMALTGSTISENQASRYGGGLFLTLYQPMGGRPETSRADALPVVDIQDTTIYHNQASEGGGLYHFAGNLSLTNTLVLSNSSSSTGGGIQNEAGANLVIIDGSVLGNQSANRGGGIFNNVSTLTIIRTGLIHNRLNDTKDARGGAIYDTGDLYLYNVSLAGNQLDGSDDTEFSGGAAIYMTGAGTPPNLWMYQTTVSGNTSQSTVDAGAIYALTGNLTFQNNIFANNTNAALPAMQRPTGGNNISVGEATVASLGGNLSDGHEAGLDDATDLLGIDPLLGPLEAYGPDRWVASLLPTSPAIDYLDAVQCTSVANNSADQRGMLRPQGAGCDSGAYEADLPPIDLEVSAAAKWDWVLIGAHNLVTTTVANNSQTAAEGVIFTTTLPAGVVIDGAIDPSCHLSNQDIICDLGKMAPAQSFSLSLRLLLTAQVPDAATLTVTAGASSYSFETDLLNNTAPVDFKAFLEVMVSQASSTLNPDQATTSPGGQSFLGEFGNEQFQAGWNGDQEYNFVHAILDVYILRSWDGNQTSDLLPPELRAPDGVVGPDRWSLSINGATVINTTFSNWSYLPYRQSFPCWAPGGSYAPQTGSVAANSLGYTFGPYAMDSTYHFDLYHPTNNNHGAWVQAEASGLQPKTDESWGLDNIYIFIRALPLPHLYLPLVSR